MTVAGTTVRSGTGYTLLEILISLSLVLLLLGGICSLLLEGQRISSGQTHFLVMHQNARTALDLMSREILMAGYDPTNPQYPFTRLPPVLEPSATSLRILADLNHDGDSNDLNENIYYGWDASTREVIRNAGSGDAVLARNISSLSFGFDHGATTLSAGAGSGDTVLFVDSTAGFQIGDLVYVAGGASVENTFVAGIAVGHLSVNPPLSGGHPASSTVACLREIVLSITAVTEEEDPQTNAFRTLSVSMNIALRNSDI